MRLRSDWRLSKAKTNPANTGNENLSNVNKNIKESILNRLLNQTKGRVLGMVAKDDKIACMSGIKVSRESILFTAPVSECECVCDCSCECVSEWMWACVNILERAREQMWTCECEHVCVLRQRLSYCRLSLNSPCSLGWPHFVAILLSRSPTRWDHSTCHQGQLEWPWE